MHWTNEATTSRLLALMPKTPRMHQIPVFDRPREKLVQKGVSSLSDFELNQVVIGNGNATVDVMFIARRVQSLLSSGTEGVTYDALMDIKGVNKAVACRILASLEIARRHLVRDATPILTLEDTLARLADIRTKKQEHVVCITLDGGQRVIAMRTITVGTLDSVPVHPREIYADAIGDRAASVIIAHNHPSGIAQPSQRDVSITQQLAGGGQLLGITMRDHLILTKNDHFSFRQHHLLYS
jgi:DNA repair protein RadC